MPLSKLLLALAPIAPTRDEDILHRRVTRALTELGVKFHPEYEFNRRNRVDFVTWIGNTDTEVGIECKTQGSALEVQRQLYRYAEFLHVLILVTTKPLAITSGTILDRHNKPCRLHVLELWRNPTP